MQSNLIAQNIKILQSEINTIAEKKVKLIAVSKKKPLAMIEQAFDLGINDFGENLEQTIKKRLDSYVSCATSGAWFKQNLCTLHRVKAA